MNTHYATSEPGREEGRHHPPKLVLVSNEEKVYRVTSLVDISGGQSSTYLRREEGTASCFGHRTVPYHTIPYHSIQHHTPAYKSLPYLPYQVPYTLHAASTRQTRNPPPGSLFTFEPAGRSSTVPLLASRSASLVPLRTADEDQALYSTRPSQQSGNP